MDVLQTILKLKLLVKRMEDNGGFLPQLKLNVKEKKVQKIQLERILQLEKNVLTK